MPAKPVQISIDPDLLKRIDSDPEARRLGRSAFIRTAVVLYLEARRRKSIDEALLKAFRGQDQEMAAEIVGLMEAQEWPDR